MEQARRPGGGFVRSAKRIGVAARGTLILTLVQFGGLSAPVAEASTFTVNSETDAVDANPGDGICATAALPSEGIRCTFRAAATESNALPGADVITLPAGTYNVTLGPSGLICPGGDDVGTYKLIGDVTIVGGGATTTIVDGNSHCQVFAVPTGTTVVMSGVTIRGGNYAAAGISSGGILTLTDAVLRDNQVPFKGLPVGGTYNGPTGILTPNRVTFINNSTAYVGSDAVLASAGRMTVTDSTFTDNATYLDTSVIRITAPASTILTLSCVTISGNNFGTKLKITDSPGSVRVQDSTISGG